MAQSEKKAQEALKISEEQFKRAIEEAPTPTILQAKEWPSTSIKSLLDRINASFGLGFSKLLFSCINRKIINF